MKKVIGIKCYGHTDMNNKFDMLKEIMKILRVTCYIQKNVYEIDNFDNNFKYKLLNMANPLRLFNKKIDFADYYVEGKELEELYEQFKHETSKILKVSI